MPNQYRRPTFAEMLLHAERACVELQEAQVRLRSAINQEVREGDQRGFTNAATIGSTVATTAAPVAGVSCLN